MDLVHLLEGGVSTSVSIISTSGATHAGSLVYGCGGELDNSKGGPDRGDSILIPNRGLRVRISSRNLWSEGQTEAIVSSAHLLHTTDPQDVGQGTHAYPQGGQ